MPRQLEMLHLPDAGAIPNSPLPLLLYRAVLAEPETGDRGDAFVALFARNGWTSAWRDGIYPFQHFHSTAHEVLGVARGEANVQLGGPPGPVVTVRAGDVIVIPAGVGHKNEGATRDLVVVGAYPRGQHADLRRGRPDERQEVVRRIATVPLPPSDPVDGCGGALLAAWGPIVAGAVP
jgi:uncharacterized protein YjlB